ncbi:MAG: ABC transporter substrate-binding protein [Candidatus Omnitrophica bacterium]|nr:ABC transporter substrate-binding protein [Candidatus Omnitrophota bacterium]
MAIRKAAAFFMLMTLLGAFNITAAETPLKEASFIPQWVPQAQFAGYYVAYEKGFYKKYGIDLTILEGGPDSPPYDALKDHKADFATLWLSTGIREDAAGAKLINIAQIVQRSALMLIAKKSSGIKEPKDIDNKKVGLWDEIFQIQPRAFFKKYGLKVKIIPQSYSVSLFLRDGVDVASAMWYNEYHTIINSGYDPDELTAFFFHEHGLNFPEEGIYTLADTFKKDPRLCRAFVSASIEGWIYAFGHEDEALDIVLKYMAKAHIPANRMHQKWMLERMKDLILAGGEKSSVGRLSPEDYHRVAEELKSNGMIDKIPDFNLFYKDCRIYDEE